jgi:Protein of unknown function (DUF3341)
MTREPAQPWGVAAEFAAADALLSAVRAVRAAGYRHAEAYAPFAIEGLPEALGQRSRGVAGACLLGAASGGLGGFLMQWYSVAVSYPVDIGGRPVFSWPMFVPVSFSLAMLCAAFAAVAAMLWRAGMPRLYHPVFNTPDFDLATRNRFFLVLRRDDPAFDAQAARALLAAQEPMRICEVPP